MKSLSSFLVFQYSTGEESFLLAGGFGVAGSKDGFYDDEFDDEETESFSLSESQKIADEFKENAKALVLKHVCNYFQDKMLHTGGKIPLQILKNEKRISLVLNSDVCSSIDKAYAALGTIFSSDEKGKGKSKKEQVPQHYQLVKSVMDDIHRYHVPKEFAGGILCLHLELVEGIVFES